MKRFCWFFLYLDFGVVGFFNKVDFVFDGEASVEWRCFIGNFVLLSFDEDIVHRDANDFSSTELNDDWGSGFEFDDFEVSGVISLLNRKKGKYSYDKFWWW